ncbi:hypothetical protein HPP92_013081 [Vanilla planifolia]|uniref:Nucleotide-diphospho-sugar transferase domain-containing protein n=1 Tax=Vanilla planifolia TaxID=51239 RepID=A0A835R2V2_VANPL|nr:hypothetical protein HPP92_013081 [Vanilla planifolia]
MLVKRRATYAGGCRSAGRLQCTSRVLSSFIFRHLSYKDAALRIGYFVFLLGVLVITLALYSALQNGEDGEVFPSVVIFAAPRPFSFRGGRPDLLGAREMLAVRSWLALGPEVTVVLFGQDSSILYLASNLGSRVTVASNIDFSFLGTPFFHCMVARSQNSSSAISVIIDPETILLPNFLIALRCAYKLDRDWFLISRTPSISNFPFLMHNTGKHWLKEDGSRVRIEKLQEHVKQELRWSNCSEKLLIAWNAGEVPLHAGILPPFLYGRGFHNSWLLHEVVLSDFRLVIDASYIASTIYPENLTYYDFWGNFSIDNGHVRWEEGVNQRLAALYGSHFLEGYDKLRKHLYFIKCSGRYAFVNAAKKVVFSTEGCNEQSFVLKLLRDQQYEMLFFLKRLLHWWIQKKWIHCILDLGNLCSPKQAFKENKQLALLDTAFTLESLLKISADNDKTVVLAVAGHNYRDMLMSWVCRLRHLHVSNFIICALDAEIYQFALLMGLPVFRDQLAPSNISFNQCHFGSECFRKVTKVKSRIVTQILKLGYNVLLSDVDVYWFNNPLPLLQSFGPSVLVVQSDEYNETGPINLPRRSNSGFYFSRSDPPTISAMEKVVKHASTSSLSEQPSFYDVMCGEGGSTRVDDNHCLEPDTNLTIHFLDRNLFPNGAYKGLWEEEDVRSACKKQGCLILHNNWINGRERKLERQVLSGLWEYDPAMRMCLQSWHQPNLTSHSF